MEARVGIGLFALNSRGYIAFLAIVRKKYSQPSLPVIPEYAVRHSFRHSSTTSAARYLAFLINLSPVLQILAD